jgi:hypothetical protein
MSDFDEFVAGNLEQLLRLREVLAPIPHPTREL